MLTSALIITVLSWLLFFFCLILVLLYLWLAYDDIEVVLRNYHLPRAKNCDWKSCGYFFHDESDLETKGCMHPKGRRYFEQLSKGGNQKGCKYSVEIRERSKEREQAVCYLKEYLNLRDSFSIEGNLWRIIALLSLVFFFSTGIISVTELITTLF